MSWGSGLSPDDRCDVSGVELSAGLLGQNGQIRGGCFESGGRRPVAFAVLAMANGTVDDEHLFAGIGGRLADGNMFDGYL